MAYELRQLSDNDRLQLPQLMKDAFMRGQIAEAPAADAEKMAQSPSLGIFDGARLVAAGTIHDLDLVWGDGAKFRMGGVAGVACVVDQRGRGHVGRLLREMLSTMHESGQVLSGLYPFSYPYYRRYGWEWVGEKRRCIVPLAEVPSFRDYEAEMVDVAEALPSIKECYARFTRRYRGMTDREAPNPNWWKGLEDRDGRRTFVFTYRNPADGRIDGYMSFRFGDSDTGQVGDFFANTPEAYRALLSTLHYYGTQLKKATWTAPVDDFLRSYVCCHDLEVAAVPLFMGRIVDVAGALGALPSGVDGKAVIAVDDPHCEWNAGTFAVETSGARVSVARTSSEAGIRLSIQALSQAFWGHPSLAQLRRAGHVDVVDEGQFTVLTSILPSAVCYLQDFF